MVQVNKPLVLVGVSAIAAAVLLFALTRSGQSSVRRVSLWAVGAFWWSRCDLTSGSLSFQSGKKDKKAEDGVREVPNLHKEQLLSILETICTQMGQVVLEAKIRQESSQSGRSLPEDQLASYLMGQFEEAMKAIESQVYAKFQTTEDEVKVATEFFEEEEDKDVANAVAKLQELYRVMTGGGFSDVEVPAELTLVKFIEIMQETMESLNVAMEEVCLEVKELNPDNKEEAINQRYVKRADNLSAEIHAKHGLTREVLQAAMMKYQQEPAFLMAMTELQQQQAERFAAAAAIFNGEQDRLESWMVKQIENADLAKETVIQLPPRALASVQSPRKARHLAVPQHRAVSPAARQELSLSPSSCSPRQQHASHLVSHQEPENGAYGAEEGIEKQWRAQFHDRRQPIVEGAHVDRTKVLRNSETDATGHEDVSPLFLWGLPREHIVEFIRQSVLPSSWATKKQAEERMEHTRRQREQLIQLENERLAAKLEAYQRRVDPSKRPLSDAELALTVRFRRRKMWLLVVSFAVASSRWHMQLTRAKSMQAIAKMQSKAAQTIQRLWRKWTMHYASKHTVAVTMCLRKCLWRLLLQIRCRRKAKHAMVLQHFMLDHFADSRETRNFNRIMFQWRGNVILAQKTGM
ncbi:hypothetical protein BBJ28_00018707 [Nothophytophthora sp. Chile5]|nr:hypothetical protein BBJ28_00018707 [Nothophytophthora sp. Chile5]